MKISKTNYLDYTYCRKNLWLKKHKPELFVGIELSEFDQKIIEEGAITDEVAQQLYPNGILVNQLGSEGISQTKELLKKKELDIEYRPANISRISSSSRSIGSQVLDHVTEECSSDIASTCITAT